VIEASAPARIDLAGGTLDLWPLHVLHPGSVTVNLAIGLRASCRVREAGQRFQVRSPARGLDQTAGSPREFLAEPSTALVGSILEALGVAGPVEIELASEVPFGSGLGGSSALTVALSAALEPFGSRVVEDGERVEFLRDVETRVLGKPAGVQDYYPPLGGGLHRLFFEAGRTRVDRRAADPAAWDRHLTLFDTGAAHSSGMNNWEIFRRRLEGDPEVATNLEAVRRAAERMSAAVERLQFEEIGFSLRQEWEARRKLAPVVSSPAIERSIDAALAAGAWGGKACGAGGGGCIVILSPPERTFAVRGTLSRLTFGRVLAAPVETAGVRVRH